MRRFADLLDTPAPDYALRPNDKNDKCPPSVVSVVTTETTKASLCRFGRSVVGRKSLPDALSELEARCPDYVEAARWQQCIADGRRFLAAWGEMAATLGWSSPELFGLHQVPQQPAATYQRLSRYDATGLIWLLQGHPVVALTKGEAAIQRDSAVVVYRKDRKPALGPFGDSLDDIGPNIGEEPR